MKFLVFQHVPHEHPGLISKFAHEHYITLDIVELWQPFVLPDPAGYDALIIMGGPMGVYEGKDAYPSKNAEVEFIQKNIDTLPMIGVCLGSQILAYALGANVYPNSKDGKQVKEIGYYDVDLTTTGQSSPIFKGFSTKFTVLQWHGDTFDIPKDSELLATSTICTNQAFSYKKAYGVQFHFEFTPEMIKKQIEADQEWIHDGFVLNEAYLLKQADDYKAHIEQQNMQFMTNFLSMINK
jgi:GMP synthase (glutamine-hydrolysing)